MAIDDTFGNVPDFSQLAVEPVDVGKPAISQAVSALDFSAQAAPPLPAAPGIPDQPKASSVAEILDQIAQTHGVDRRTLEAFAKIESGFDPKVKTGSYKGLFQLSDEEFARHGGQGDIFDPVANATAAASKIKTEQADFERRYGRAPSASELYLIHQQGVGGADAHWKNPDAPAWQNMAATAEGRQKGENWAKRAIWGNLPPEARRRFGDVNNVTSRDFVALWDDKVTRFGGGRTDREGAVQLASDTGMVDAGPALDFSSQAIAPTTGGLDFSSMSTEGEKKPEAKTPTTFLQAGARGIDQMQGMLYGGVEAFGEATGIQPITNFGREGRERNAKEAEAYGPAAEALKIRSAGDFGQWVKETVGSQIPIMGPMLGGAVAGTLVGGPIGGLIGAFVPGFVMSTGEVQSNIKEKDPTAVAPSSAFIGGAAIAALDSVIPGKVGSALVRRFGTEAAEEIAKRALTKPVTQSMLKTGAKGAVTGMATEGVTEAIQEAVGEVAAAYGTGQPINPNIGSKMAEAGLAGTLMGGFRGLFGSGPVQTSPADDETKKTPEAPSGTPSAASTPPQPTPASSGTVRPPSPMAAPEEAAVLSQMGYSPDDIAGMTRAEVEAELADAAAAGVTVPPKSADAPSAEPISDLTAQIADIKAGSRKGVFLSQENIANIESNPAFVGTMAQSLQAIGGVEIVENIDGKGGVLVAKDKATADAARAAISLGVTPETVLGLFTGSGTGKAPGADTVVQQKTPDGAVTRETLVPAAEAPAAAAELAADGRTVEAMPAADAIARRDEMIAAEQTAATAPEGDGTRQAPVKVEIPEDVAVAAKAAAADYTPAQGEANNRKLGHAKWNGLDISIETEAGGVRKGVNKTTGEPWETTMGAAYGYIKGGPKSGDGMALDVFMGTDPASDRVWVIDEISRGGTWRQHKAMIAFPDRESAIAAYTGTSSKTPQMIGGVTEMTVAQFRSWTRNGNTSKPLNYKAPRKAKLSDPMQETALTVIRRLGGVQPNAEIRRIVDKASIPGLLNKNGLTPDDMLRALEGESFVQDRSGPNQPIETTLDDLYDIIDKIVAGERVGRYGTTVEKPMSRKAAEAENRAQVMRYIENEVEALGVRSDFSEAEEDRLFDLVENQRMSVDDAIERVAIESIENAEAADDAGASVEDSPPFGSNEQEAGGEADAREPGRDAGQVAGEEVVAAQEPAEEVAAPQDAIPQAPETGLSDSEDVVVTAAELPAGVPTFADVKLAVKEGDPLKVIREYLEGKGWPARWAKLSDEQKRTAFAEISGAKTEPEVKPAAAEETPAPQQAEPETPAATDRGGDRLKDYTGIIIDGYAGQKPGSEQDGPVKRGFLSDARAYLLKVSKELAARGFVPYEDRKGKPQKPVSVDPAGPAVSGDVSLSMIDNDANGIYVEIGTTLAGPKGGISLMARRSTRENQYSSGQNNSLPVGLTVKELADRLEKIARPTAKTPAPATTTEASGQTSLVPEATTKEKIAAAASAKGNKGKGASDDAGPLFNPDAGAQTDLVDMAKAPGKKPDAPAKTPEQLANELLSASLDAQFEAKPDDTYNGPRNQWVERTGDMDMSQKLDADGETVGAVMYDRERQKRNRMEAWAALDADGKVIGYGPTMGHAKDIVDGKKPAETPAPKKSGKAAAKSAAVNVGKGLEEAAAGLMALFDPKGKLGSGPSFDEQTYAKAKPHFEAAVAHFAEAGADMATAMRELVKYLAETAGMSRDGIEAMRPYIVRFMVDREEGVGAGAGTDYISTQETQDASPAQSEPVPAADQTVSEADAAAGDGDRQQVGARVAGDSKGASGRGRVSGRPEGAGSAGARGSERAREQSPGPARDRAGERTEPQSSDFVIDADEIGKGGLGKKYRDNVAAIRLLKTLEAEGRKATADERKELAKYVGWGAMKGPFDPANKTWAKQHAELKELLTDAEFKAARRSVLNAHYTSPAAIQAMNAALERMGYTGGRMLEPSVGIGNFFGLMPADMRHNSQLHGVELDSLTSRMVAALYPKANIAKATGFQDFSIPNGYFDLVQGNPPFGSESVSDLDRSPYSGFSIHNYFLAKGIDKLRPGGLMQVIVSHNFLDAQGTQARKWIADRANLIAAVRLPNTAFEENAGTVVVTDILTFQRRHDGEAPNHIVSDWINVVDQSNTNPKTGETVTHKVSPIFVEKPDLVLGKPSAAGTMNRANEYTVEASGDLKAQLGDWVKTLPEGIYQPIQRKAEADVDMAVPDGVKVGSFFVNDSGEILQRGPDEIGNKTTRAWVASNSRAALRMKGMIALRDALRTQMRLERSPDASTAEIEDNRRLLNHLYDEFLKKHGHLNSQTNRRLFLDDTEAQLVQALEFDYDKGVSKATAEKEGIDPREPSATKADIFKRRVAFPPQDFLTVTTAKDALLASLNYRGKIDPVYLREVYGKPLDTIVDELGEIVYEDPDLGLVTADEYLSGDVKTKLDTAKAAAARDAKYQRNVDALEKVIPADKKPSEISVSIGAAFIPAEVYGEFVRHISGANVNATYVRATGQWLLSFSGQSDPALNTGKYGTDQLSATELFQLSMFGRGAIVRKIERYPDGTTTTIVLQKETEAAREKQNAIKAEWQSWLWRDPARAERIAAIYNEKMNRIVDRKFDGGHLSFPGMNPAITLLDHQKNGVWRGLQSYQVLYDHVVGAGKTFEMATLAMEMRRLGIARKPLFVVPNHLTLQWRSEFTRLYPGSNILAATPEDFSKENRERLFSKIVTGDWDAVVIGHSSLKKIGLPAATERGVLQEQVDELAEAIEMMKRERGDRNILRDMEKIKSNLESKMAEKLAAIGARSKVVTFDDLGVDAMFVDEMHEFKNLMYNSTMDRNPGMGNPKGSDKAFDLFVKVRWLFNTFGEKTPFITATGTPVSNSLVEMFTMQRYMQYPTLRQEGLHVFDAWAKQFGNVENVYEVAPSGSGYRQSTRFAKFTNLPALMGLYNSFADTVTLDDLKAQEEAQGKRFPVPRMVGGRPQIVVAKRSPAVASFMGVPTAATTEDGTIEFIVDLSKPIEINQDDKTGKWNARVGDTPVGTFDSREDAQLKIVEDAVTPIVGVDPESILGRFARLKQLTKETKGKVNALSLTGEANKAGLDYRLIDPSAPDFSGSKINLAVDNMVRLYRKWRSDKGTQLVFCDLSIPLSARASYSSKARRLYVRNDAGAIEMKRGTMHTLEGQESLPYFILTRGDKELRRFDVYDAASGVRMLQDARAKNDAIDQANALLSDQNKRQAWIDKRERAGEIAQEEIDEYNNENDIETDGVEAFTREDIAGVSGAAAFSVYDDIRAKLIKKDIPEREIAFIHDYATPTAKDKLFKAVNSGEIRFLLGSTPKMGAGTNVQKRLVALHHIDAPWRPSDLEQREGRIIRRGNELYTRDPDGFEVFIGRYATEQTYDTRRWQILEHKARGIEQLRNYDGTFNEIDDIEGEAANAADMKAAASGDPLILEETRLRNDVRRLELLQAAHADDAVAMNAKAKSAEFYATYGGPERVRSLQELQATVKANPANKDGWAAPTLDGEKIEDKEAAEEKIAAIVDEVRADKRPFAKVVYRGLSFEFKKFGGTLYVDDPEDQQMGYWLSDQPFSASGYFQRMRNYVDRIPSRIESTKAEIAKMAESAVGLREQAKVPFSKAEALEKAREDHKNIRRALMAKGPSVPDEQKAAVAAAIQEQKKRLNALGLGKALREFYRTPTAQDVAQEIGAAGQIDAAISAKNAVTFLKMGRTVAIADATRQAVHEALAPVRHIVSNGTQVATMKSIVPKEKLEGGDRKVEVTFETAEGDEFKLILRTSQINDLRAFRVNRVSGPPAIVFLRFGMTDESVETLRGELWHEAIHDLRRSGALGGEAWDRLLSHARGLRLLDTEVSTYLRMIGVQGWDTVGKGTLGEQYRKLYAKRADRDETLDQEAVAHFVELASNNQLLPMEIDPVRDILVDIWTGKVAGKGAAETRAVEMASSVPGYGERMAPDAAAAIKDAVEIVARIAGRDVTVRTEARLPEMTIDGGTARPGGLYQKQGLEAKAVITLAYADPRFDARTVAGHEAYHHVESELASPAEMALLRSPAEMERAARHAAAEIGRSVEETRKLPDYEIRAIAFQRYRRMREEGMTMTPLHIGIRRLWDAMVRLVQGVKNALRGKGFDSMEAIFERARTGEMAARAAARRSDATAATAPRPADRSAAIQAVARRVANDDRARAQASDVSAFAGQWLTKVDGAATSATSLYEAYVLWATDAGADVVTLRTFNQMLGDLGYERAHVAGRTRWMGVAIKAEGERPAAALGEAPANPIADANAAEVAAELEKGVSISEAFRRVGQRLMQMLGLAPERAAETESRIAHLEAMQTAVANDNSATAAIHGNVVALPSQMASIFPTATSTGTVFGRRVAAIMRRMSPRTDQWRVRLQDRFLMMRRQQEAIERQTGVALPVSLDVYVAESLYHGRAGERMADLQQERVEPLVEHMRTHDIDADELGEYLYARHAGERNAYIRTIDPGNDAGSGMTDADAQAIVGRIQAGPKAQAFAHAAALVDRINAETRDTLLASGLISRETYDAWSTGYKHYVPLRGFETVDEEEVFPLVGRGFNIRGPEARAALGRRSKSDNPVAYVLLQAQQAIVRAEKNRVNKTLLRLVESHPDPDVWQIYRGEYRRRLNETTGQVETYFVPAQFSAHDPSIVGVKVGGKQRYIKINNPNLARALRGVGASEFDHAIVRNMMALTRFYAQFLTSWNPEFVVGNFFRDVQTALINSKDVADLPSGARKKMLAEALSLKSIRGIYNALRGDGSHPHAHYFEEFRQAGGKISFMEMNDVERIKSRINGLLTEGNTRRAIRRAAKYVEDLNTSVENGVRLSTYIAMREAGISQTRAASVARELTVNFNRKGEWGPIINAAYMFFNASVQGSTRMLQALARSKAVRRVVYAIAFGGFAVEILNYLISGDDDDKENAYDKIKPWIKERNMIFMLPGRKDYLMIPMPYGYNVPYIAGQKIGEMVRTAAGHGKLTPAKAAAGIMSAMMDSFNPLGTSPTVSFLQMMSPTILDPVVQVAENKTWYGGPIFPTKYDRNKPDSESYFASVHPAFIEAAKWLNRATGGNAAKPGAVDVSPEVLEHYATFLGGGVAKFLLNATGTGQRALAGEEFIPEKTPIVRRLYGASTTVSRRADFNEAWTKIDGVHYEWTQLGKAGDSAGAQRARAENKAEIEAYPVMSNTQRMLSRFRKQATQIQLDRGLSDAERKTKLDEIKNRENELIKKALEVYARAQKQSPVP